MFAPQSPDCEKMEGFITTAKNHEKQLKILNFMDRAVSGPVLPPPPPMTSKQAKMIANQRWRSIQQAPQDLQQARMRETEERRKRAIASANRAEARRAKARLPKEKKPIKLIEGQGVLPVFGFTGARQKVQAVNSNT